jgi:hypothetical protein
MSLGLETSPLPQGPGAVSVLAFGAKCDAVSTSGTWSGTDDTTAIQAAFNAVGFNGVTKITFPGPGQFNGTGFTTGFCKISSQLTLGNGTSTSYSNQNGIHIEGIGGQQEYTTGGVGGYHPPTPGTTVLAYTGSNLVTTPVFLIQGPCNNIHISGIAIDCHDLAQTGLYVTQAARSSFEDMSVMNNSNSTNVYNAAFWFDAWNVTLTGQSGTQYSHYKQLSALALTASPTGFMIGAVNENNGGAGNNGHDLSECVFEEISALYYGSNASVGVCFGFCDSNTFSEVVTASQVGFHLLYQGDAFPGSNDITHWQCERPNSYVGTMTLAPASIPLGITAGITSTSQTANYGLSITGGALPPVPFYIQIGAEIIQVLGMTGTKVTSSNRSVSNTPPGTYSPGAAVSGPHLPAIRASGTFGVTGGLGNTLFLNPVITPGGEPMNSNSSLMIDSNVYAVVGVTQSGFKFNTPYSGPFNPAVMSNGFGSTISNTTTAISYFSKTVSLSAEWIHNRYAVVRIKGMFTFTNTSGVAVPFAPVFMLTDITSGSPTIVFTQAAGRQWSIASGISGGTCKFDITLDFLANSYSGGSVTVEGDWLIDDNVYSQGGATFSVSAGGGTSNSRDFSAGVVASIGVQFATTSATATATQNALNFWIDVPSLTNGII